MTSHVQSSPTTKLEDESVELTEELYRAFRALSPEGKFKHYAIIESRVVISGSAFDDRDAKVSVDRGKLCNSDPNSTRSRLDPNGGIIIFLAGQLIGQTIPVLDAKGKNIAHHYELNILPDPIKQPPVNLAHAVIIPNPDYATTSHFKRMKEKLAFIATHYARIDFAA